MKFTKDTNFKEGKSSTIGKLNLMCSSNIENLKMVDKSSYVNNHSNYDYSNLESVDKMIEEERKDRFTSFCMLLNEGSKKAEVHITEGSRKKLAKSLIR